MKITEIRALATPEVESKLEDTREELFHLRFQFKTGELTDYSRLKETRRNIARFETVLRERLLAAQLAAEEK
jgi:large subunit ribosomal protein L29